VHPWYTRRPHCPYHGIDQQEGPQESPASILAHRIGWSGKDHHRLYDLQVAERSSPAIRLLDSRDSKLLVTTLCHDLAEPYPSYAASVLLTLETNSRAVHAGFCTQIDELLSKPWQASIAQQSEPEIATPVLIVDAFDESDPGTKFLEELLCVIQLLKLSIFANNSPECGLQAAQGQYCECPK
jgi:hypothetical protein